jgi:transcriptional regulator with XRE-family HTH domain
VATRDPGAAFLKAFGRAVRERRSELDLSQEDLGFRAEIDRTYVSGVERGVRNVTLRVVLRLSTALGVDPADLLADVRAIRASAATGARGRIASDRPR